MKCIIVGVQDMDFEARDKSKIDGVKLHFLTTEQNIKGKAANFKFVDREVFDSFGVGVDELCELIGAEIDIEFNHKQKICGIRI